MKKLVLLFLIISLPFMLLAQLKGKVVSIIDGDTVVLLDSLNTQHRIRLHGIDCPEKGQEFYQVAKDYLAQLCFQKHVNVEVTGKDRYQRTVGRICFANQDLN